MLLDQIHTNYPMVMHGVAMSIGAASGIDEDYLKCVKERDDNIPAISELLAEVATARRIASELPAVRNEIAANSIASHTASVMKTNATAQSLRACFGSPDVSALDTAAVAADREGRWMSRSNTLHPTLVLREISTNTVALRRAIDADAEVPEAVKLPTSVTLAVWRKGLQPHFKTLEAGEAAFVRLMMQGHCIADVSSALEGTEHLADPMTLARWMSEWWEDGFLAAPPPEFRPPELLDADES